MGMKSMGLGIAEFQPAPEVSAADTVIINHFTDFTAQNNYWTSREATLSELGSFILGGVTVLAIGKATLAAGTATVALSTITSGSLVFLTENSASPNALGAVVTAGTGFVIHSASGSDTSVVNYIVYS
jgi:hypothetical protein